MQASFEQFRAAIRRGDRAPSWRDGRPHYVLTSQMFDRRDLEQLFALADAIRAIEAEAGGRDRLAQTLRHQRGINLFAQPSTRTCESFVAASTTLGAPVRVLHDLDATSMVKGESVEDTLRTLASFYDWLVVRHPDETFAERAAWASSTFDRPIPVISAGSGKSEHPTQALLDLYTLFRAWRGELDGRSVLLVGDIGRNRAARSLAQLLPRFSAITLHIACHPDHRPEPAFLDSLERAGIRPRFHASIGEALAHPIDAIYLTRLQQEWDAAAAPLGTAEAFILHPELRDRVRPECLILHPLPRVNELPDAWADHPGFLIWHQVRNGVTVRAALLAWMAGADAGLRA